MRSTSLLILLAVSLIGCGEKNAPMVTYGSYSPTEDAYQIYNPKTKMGFVRTVNWVNGWTCLDPVSITNFFKACNNFLIQPPRVQCLIRNDEVRGWELACFDGVKQKAKNVPVTESAGYVCTDANDFIFLFNYCEDKRLKHLAEK